MSYGEAKVYFDGSHYIAIPYNKRKLKRRPRCEEERITVKDVMQETHQTAQEEGATTDNGVEPISPKISEVGEIENERQMPKESLKIERQMTKKELFNMLYDENINAKKNERRKKIIVAMLPYFKTKEEAELYVDLNIERKQRNLIARRIRMCRKASLVDFNYFCTFTYSDALHTEESFKKKLKNILALLSCRKQWKYMGVWERSPKKKRLHFHGLFQIPNGTMPGEIISKRDYSFATHQMRTTYQNTYFNERFGRSDFETIDDPNMLGSAMAYLMKYIEKTGEKIVYSKGLYQYFISDIMDDDVICTIGMEDKKLLLYDDFQCIDEGTIMGKVNKDTIRLMRKAN